MNREIIVSKKLIVEGPVTTRDSMNRGMNEKSESVFGFAYA